MIQLTRRVNTGNGHLTRARQVRGVQDLNPWLCSFNLLASLKSLLNLFSFSDCDSNMYLLNKLNKVPKGDKKQQRKGKIPCKFRAQRLSPPP